MPKLIMNVNCVAVEDIEGPNAHELETLVRCQYEETIKELTEMVRNNLKTGGYELQNVTFEIGE